MVQCRVGCIRVIVSIRMEVEVMEVDDFAKREYVDGKREGGRGPCLGDTVVNRRGRRAASVGDELFTVREEGMENYMGESVRPR